VMTTIWPAHCSDLWSMCVRRAQCWLAALCVLCLCPRSDTRWCVCVRVSVCVYVCCVCVRVRVRAVGVVALFFYWPGGGK
jgi:hypothetical protein